MATYDELMSLHGTENAFRNRVRVALTVAADAEILSATLDNQKWAAAVFSNPKGMGDIAHIAVLAANKDTALASIVGATDAQIQAKVNLIVPGLIAAHNAV